MANRYANLVGSNKIKDEWQKINEGFDKVEQDVDQLRVDLDQEIADREAAVEYVDQRVDTIIVGGGPDKDPELVDIRTPAPEYTPLEPITTAGGMTRDMQKQLASLRAEMVTGWANAAGYGAVGGNTDDSAAVQAAVDDAVSKGLGTLYIPFSKITLGSDVDCKGLRVVGNQTNVSGILKNASYFEGVIINGFDYDDIQIDPIVTSTSASPKVLYKSNNNTYYLITRKAGGKGYVFYWLEKYVRGADDKNYGPPGELLRVTTVWNVLQAIVYKRTYSAVNGTWEDYATSGVIGRFWRNTSQNPGDFIEFTVDVPENGKFNLAFLTTGASSRDVTVEVDGIEIDNLDLSNSPNRIWVKEYEAKPGTRTIRLTNNESRSIYVAGCNYYQLKDADVDREYDAYAYTRDDNHYIDNKGAMDYAMVEAETGKYCGSYHGGESVVSLKIVADGQEISLANGELDVMVNLSIEQETDIISKLTSVTSQRFIGDGVFEFAAQFTGDINVHTLYTAMTTTYKEFDKVDYPIQADMTPGYHYMGRKNKIVQRRSDTNQKITTMFTLFGTENSQAGGLFVNSVEDGYKKVYYGKVRGSYQNIKNLAFTTVRIFE